MLHHSLSGHPQPGLSDPSSLQGMISPGGATAGYPPSIYAPSGAYESSPNGSVMLQNVRAAMHAAPGETGPTWIHPAKQSMNVVAAPGGGSFQKLDPYRWGKPATESHRASPPRGPGLMNQWRYPEIGAGVGVQPGMQPIPPQWAPTAGAALQQGVPMGPGQGAAQGGLSYPTTDPGMGSAGPQLWSATGQRPLGVRGAPGPQPTAAHPLQGPAGPVGMRPAGLTTPVGVNFGAAPQPAAAHPLQGPGVPVAMRPAGLTPARVPMGSRSWKRGSVGASPTQDSLSDQPSEVLLQRLLDKANAFHPAAAAAVSGGGTAAAAAPTRLSVGGVGAPARPTPRKVTPQQMLQSQSSQGLRILCLPEQDRRKYLEVSASASTPPLPFSCCQSCFWQWLALCVQQACVWACIGLASAFPAGGGGGENEQCRGHLPAAMSLAMGQLDSQLVHSMQPGSLAWIVITANALVRSMKSNQRAAGA